MSAREAVYLWLLRFSWKLRFAAAVRLLILASGAHDISMSLATQSAKMLAKAKIEVLEAQKKGYL